MANLPFVVAPRLKPITEMIGSEDAGYIEIERKGYLSAGEKSFVQQVQQSDSSTLQLIALAREVASGKGVTLEDAYNAVIETITGENKTKLSSEISVEFAEQIQMTLTGLANSKLREELVFATCLLTYRVDSSTDISDVIELHPDIINGLAELYRDEERKCIDRLKEPEIEKKEGEEEVLDLEEIEKKQK